MDLIKKYSKLAEAKTVWPGTPEYKKRFDPSFNPYDPEGKVKKALKLAPYGSREKQSSDEDEKPASQPATKGRGRPKKMSEAMSAYGRIDARFKKLSGRSMGDAAKEHEAEAKKLQKEIEDQQKEIERRQAAMKKEEVGDLEEKISVVPAGTPNTGIQRIKLPSGGTITTGTMARKPKPSATLASYAQKAGNERRQTAMRKEEVEQTTPVYNQHIKGMSTYKDIVKKHGRSKTNQIISQLTQERNSLRKHSSDWAGPAHLKKHDMAIQGLTKAVREGVQDLEAEQIEELKATTLMSYKDKANKEIKALDKEVKSGEYKDIVGKIMDKRMKGADRAANKLVARNSNSKPSQIGEESLTAGKRLISKHGEGAHTARVYKDTEYNEYQVHHYKDGKHMGEGPVSYHSDKEDAESTAKASLKQRMAMKEELEINEASNDLTKISTDKLKAHWNKHKDQERPSPTFAMHLKKVASELKKRNALKEEVEELDELKKSTLASYVMKAADSAKSKKDAAANMYRFTKQVTSAMKKSTEGDKRIEGIKSATKRLAKEEYDVVSKYLYTTEQSNNNETPFKPSPKKQIALPGKYGAGYSTARHLARMGLKAAIKDLKKGPEAGKKQIS